MLTSIVPESSSISALRAKVEFFDGSTSVLTCTCDGALKEFSLYREGDTSKFFGFGVSHKATINLIDLHRDLPAIEKGYRLEISLGDGTIFDKPFPSLYVAEITREEKSRDITCTVVDVIQAASSISVSELNLTAPYTLADVANSCAALLGLNIDSLDDTFNLSFPNGANFSGDENLREVLNDIAEATQTIYYINNENKLVFKRLDKSGNPVLTITKENYFELTTQTTRTLSNIYHTTELGDNLYAGDDSGTDQYVRDNAFWSNRTDLGELIEAAVARVAGTSITQFDCEWDGNYLLEIGDKIGLVTEDDSIVHSYVLDDVIEFEGYLNQTTAWEFTQDDNSTAANPTSIGEKINQTFARVDKVNKEISLLAQATTENSSEIAELKLTTDNITLRVEKIENSEIEIEVDLENDANFIALKERVGQLEISDTNITASISNVETTLRGEINSSATNLNNALKQEIADGDSALNNEIVAVKQNIASLELEADNITASVTALETKTSTDLSTAVSNLETVISNNNTELTNTLRAEIEAGDGEIITEVNTVKSELGELKVSTDAITLRVKDLEETTIDLDTDESFIALTNRVGALEVSDTQINASISNTETIVKKYTDDAISGVESDLSSLEDTLRGELTAGDEALGGEITTIKQDVSNLSVRAGVIEASVSSVESSVTTKIDTAVDELETSIGNLESSLQEEIETGDNALDEKITVVKSNISTLQVESAGISASVKSLENKTDSSLGAVDNTISALTKEVNLKVDADAVNISINKALEEGVDKVKTSSKNYTFDDTGLNISSSDTAINTTVTEDGMRIYKYNQEVLTANNQGVTATDLHARTYLIIGENSRLEDRGNRTACFWIGPAGG